LINVIGRAKIPFPSPKFFACADIKLWKTFPSDTLNLLRKTFSELKAEKEKSKTKDSKVSSLQFFS